MNLLERLEALARAATPGPWEAMPHFTPDGGAWIKGVMNEETNDRPHIANVVSDAENAAYIAASNPTAILALCAQLRQARVDTIEYVAQQFDCKKPCFYKGNDAECPMGGECSDRTSAFIKSLKSTGEK